MIITYLTGSKKKYEKDFYGNGNGIVKLYYLPIIKEKLKTVVFYNNLLLNECPQSRFFGNDKLFSQTYEDYILSYIFADKTDGFYIDVGANHPEHYSTTKYFHLKGWQGMVVEPIAELSKLFKQVRPQAININKAVSSKEGKETLYVITKANALSSLHQEIEQLAIATGREVEKREVELTTLNHLLSENNITSEISFIKIDVENHEEEVLKGLDLNKYRPLILVLETASPKYVYGHVKWEPILTKAGYKFGANDGFNRYYFRQESPELKDKFRYISRCVKAERLVRDVSCDHLEECTL